MIFENIHARSFDYWYHRLPANSSLTLLVHPKVYNANTGTSMMNVSFQDLAGIDHPHSRRVQKMKNRALDEGFVDEARR